MKKKLYAILERLGFKQKFEDKSLSQEEFNVLVAEYQKEYKTTIEEDIQAEKSASEQNHMQETLNMIHAAIAAVAPEAANPAQENATTEDVVKAINNLGASLQRLAAEPEKDKYKVVRGGSYIYGDSHARASFRSSAKPDDPAIDFGFRCVASPK